MSLTFLQHYFKALDNFIAAIFINVNVLPNLFKLVIFRIYVGKA